MAEATLPRTRRPPVLRAVWQDLRNARELWAQFTLRDIRLRYKQAVLGAAWALLLPALLIGAGVILKMAMFRSATPGEAPSLGGITIKGWAWAFFAGAMNFATMSVLQNVQIVIKIYFPREVLPLASISAQLVDAAIGGSIIALLGPFVGFRLTWALLWVPVLMLLLVGLTTALGFIFACANLFFRDVKYILQVLLTFGVFFTPVFFDLSSFSHAWMRWALLTNPLTSILEGFRYAVVEGMSLTSTVPASAGGPPFWSPLYLVYTVAVIAVLLPFSVVLFRRSSAQFAEFY